MISPCNDKRLIIDNSVQCSRQLLSENVMLRVHSYTSFETSYARGIFINGKQVIVTNYITMHDIAWSYLLRLITQKCRICICLGGTINQSLISPFFCIDTSTYVTKILHYIIHGTNNCEFCLHNQENITYFSHTTIHRNTTDVYTVIRGH